MFWSKLGFFFIHLLTFSGELKFRVLPEVLPRTMLPGFFLAKSEIVSLREKNSWFAVGLSGSGEKILAVDGPPTEPWVV
jgi:hypothetical protein